MIISYADEGTKDIAEGHCTAKARRTLPAALYNRALTRLVGNNMSIPKTKTIKAAHPGKIVSDYIRDAGLSQSEIARRLGVPIGNINEICRGKRGISPEMAFKLARLFSTSPELWMNLQKNWELSQVDPTVAAKVRPIRRAA